MKRLLLIALSVISAFTLCFALTACKEDGKIDIAYEKVYTITYDYDGDLMRGGVKLTSKTETVKENEISSFTLPTAVKKGYGFSGWLNNGEVFTTASFSSELTLKLTPEFTSRSYVFNYNHEGDLMRGDESAAKSETVAYSDLSGFTLPAAIKRGYTFKRWLNGDEEFDLSALDEDATYNLTPEFTVNTYTIIYGFDGDVLRDGVKLTGKTETVAFDKLSDYKLPDATKKGYTFDKWMNGTMPFDKSGVDASATFTLTAKFTANVYTLNYDAETVKRGETELTVKQETFTADDLANGWVLPAAVKTGYTFGGWHASGALFDLSMLDESATVTLSPLFTANTYKVNYYFNEDDAEPIFVDTATFDSQYTVKSQADLIKQLEESVQNFGYNVIGWKKSGEKFTSGVYTTDGDIKLVAEKSSETGDTFNFTLRVNGLAVYTQSVAFNDAFVIPAFDDSYGLTAQVGYHYEWVDESGAKMASGSYTYKYRYDLTLDATQIKNSETVNFVVIGNDTNRYINLTTASVVLSTGDTQPQVIFEANASYAGGTVSFETVDGKTRVRVLGADKKVNYYRVEWRIGSVESDTHYVAGEAITVETDNSAIEVYAVFVLIQETPNG